MNGPHRRNGTLRCCGACDRDAELRGILDEFVGDPRAGEGDDAFRHQVEQPVVAPEMGVPSMAVLVGLHTT